MRRLTLSLFALAPVACAETPSPGASPGGTSIEVKVAPLTLPGLGDACYDVEVRNGAAEIVWARGDFNVQHPADPTTLCARQFGNGSGGDISYVGPCDADSPGHVVYLAVDTLYDAVGQPLSDWQNPCPGSTPCKLNVTCEENADTPVSFNLTIMRAAQQGFFDIAVNFDAIFCSAKVDCTYDDAGNEPIELLHDPATGERVQTAVIGLACSAGPGSDVDTALMMSDIRIYCGETSPVMFAGYQLFTCDDAGAAHYGVLQSLGAEGLAFDGAVWLRDLATGAYAASPIDFTNLPPVPVDDPDTAWGGMVYAMLDTDQALVLLARTGSPTNPADPFSTFRDLRPALATRISPDTFTIDFVSDIESDLDPAAVPLALPVLSDPDTFLVVRNTLDGGSDGPSDLRYTAFARTAPDAFGPPIRLDRPMAGYARCDSESVVAEDAVIATCERTDGTHDVFVWDLTGTPTDPGTGVLTLSASVLNVAPGDFTFSALGTNDGQPATVSEIVEVQNLGFIRGEGGEADHLYLTAWLRFDNADNDAWVAVHAQRAGIAAFDFAPPPYGQRPLPSDPSPAPPPPSTEGTHARGIVMAPAGLPDDRPVFLGAFQFDDAGYRRVVIRHDPTGASHEIVREFWEEAVGGTQLFTNDAVGGLFHPNGDFFVLSDAWYQDGIRRPFLARATALDGVAMALPVPDGYSLEAISGVRGATTPVLGAPRRLTGLVVDPAGERRIITWGVRARATDGEGADVNDFELVDWSVHGTTDVVDNALADWDDLRRDSRYDDEVSPRFDAALRRCPQTVDAYVVDDTAPLFSDAALIVDPALDVPGVDAVSTHTPLTAAGFSVQGTLIVREPVDVPADLLPTLEPGAATLLDPTHTAEGNVWTSTNPKPAGVPAHILQMASYHGEESLQCDGESCNKLYWNTAIAFDPTVPDCRLAFEATAARVSSLVGGQLPPNTSWPMLIGRVPLTTSAEEGQEASLACTRHPLGSPRLQTLYKPQDFDWQACYGFGTTGAPPEMTGGGECPLTAEDYLMFEFMILAGGGEGP